MKSKDIKTIKLNSDYFLINWHPTRWCNYHCSYCVNTAEKNVSENQLLKTANDINNFIKTLPETKKIYFKLIGGEVSFYDWAKILSKIDRINKITMTTNFSNSLEYYMKLYQYTKSRDIDFNLMCSKHSENIDYDRKIIDLTEWCRNNQYTLPIVRLMVDNTFDLDNYYYLKSFGCKLNLSIIRDENKKVLPLNEKLYSFMQNYWNEQHGNYATVNTTNGSSFIISNAVQFANTLEDGGFDPTDFLCSAGHNGIVIEPNGNVYRCGCRGIIPNSPKIHISDFKLDQNIELSKCFINNKNKSIKNYCALCWYVNLKQQLETNND